jgi:hypothetical protein
LLRSTGANVHHRKGRRNGAYSCNGYSFRAGDLVATDLVATDFDLADLLAAADFELADILVGLSAVTDFDSAFLVVPTASTDFDVADFLVGFRDVAIFLGSTFFGFEFIDASFHRAPSSL